MVHTIRVYAYGTTIRVYAYGTTIRVWYGYLYHMRIVLLLLFTSNIYIAITNTVLLFVIDHVHMQYTAFCSDVLHRLMHAP